MKFHELPCLICGKQLQVIYKGKDDPAIYPCIVGGTIEISFGYGSKNDTFDGDEVCQGLICDKCFGEVENRTRTVVPKLRTIWEELCF